MAGRWAGRVWSRVAGIVVLVVLAGLASACDDPVGRQRVAVCRALAMELAAGDPARVVNETVRAGGRSVVVRTAADAGRATHTVECRFATGGLGGADPTAVTGVRIDGRALGPARFYFLQRLVLSRPEIESPSGPVRTLDSGDGPRLSRWLAIPLQHLLAAAPMIGLVALLSTAYALVYGLVGRIYLAFGELAAIGGVGALMGMVAAGSDRLSTVIATGLILAVAAAVFHGLAGARLVLSPLLRPGTGRHAIIATLGLAIALQEYLRLLQGSRAHWISVVGGAPIVVAHAQDMAVTASLAGLATLALALACAFGVVVMLHGTRWGRSWRACSQDPLAAALMGISAERTLIVTLTVASALAGVAGFALTVVHGGVGPAGGTALGLKALIGAVIGGIGSVPGALAGGLIVGVGEALWAIPFPIEQRELAVFTLLVVVLVLRPFGWRGRDNGVRPV